MFQPLVNTVEKLALLASNFADVLLADLTLIAYVYTAFLSNNGF